MIAAENTEHVISGIRFGHGVIPWAEALRTREGRLICGAGWVLPGGERTTNEKRAEAAAQWIHRRFKESGKEPAVFVNRWN